MHRSTLVCFLAACATITACDDATDSSRQFFGTQLNGASERPAAVTTTATGVFSAEVHPVTNTLSYSLTWTGLSGTVTGAHIHGPADASQTANILINFQALPAGSTNQAITTGASGSASGNVNLELPVTATVSGDSLRKLLDAGQLYVNVHTAANPNGEIRGQIARQ